MSFFKKALSRIGIGAAKVDCQPDQSAITAGETLTGTILVVGGSVEQDINKVEVVLCCNYFDETTRTDSDGDTETIEVEKTAKIASVQLDYISRIEPERTVRIPFELVIPKYTPITAGRSRVWLETALDIDYAIDQHDKDHLKVDPSPTQYAFLEVVESMGFTLTEVQCDKAKKLPLGIGQEFEYKPLQEPYRSKLDEIEFVFYESDEALTVWFEVDKRARGLKGIFSELLNTDEQLHRLIITSTDKADIKRQLDAVLDV